MVKRGAIMPGGDCCLENAGGVSQMKSIDIKVRWVSVLNEDGTPYKYPEPLSRFLKKHYPKPVIYRWRILPVENDKETIYIGQTEDLHQRIQRVLTPSKKAKAGDTNQKLKRFFDEQRSLTKEVILEIPEFEPFEFNDVRFSPDDLLDQFKRLALENLLLSFAQDAGYVLLNEYELAPITMLKKQPFSKQREVFKNLGLEAD